MAFQLHGSGSFVFTISWLVCTLNFVLEELVRGYRQRAFCEGSAQPAGRARVQCCFGEGRCVGATGRCRGGCSIKN